MTYDAKQKEIYKLVGDPCVQYPMRQHPLPPSLNRNVATSWPTHFKNEPGLFRSLYCPKMTAMVMTNGRIFDQRVFVLGGKEDAGASITDKVQSY